jgi:hypothetical protein
VLTLAWHVSGAPAGDAGLGAVSSGRRRGRHRLPPSPKSGGHGAAFGHQPVDGALLEETRTGTSLSLVVGDVTDRDRWRGDAGDEVGEHGGGVACMPGMMCWHTVMVNAGLAWPWRSLTTFTGTPDEGGDEVFQPA